MKAKCHQINKPCGVHKTELSESLTVRAARLADALEQSVRGFIMASDQNLGEPVWPDYSEAGAGLLPAVRQVAFSGRPGVGFGRHRGLFAAGAGDGGVAGQQDAGKRGQCGAGTFDGSKAAPGDAGSGSAAAG